MMARLVVVAGLALLAAACRHEQSFAEAMKVACEIPEDPDIKKKIDSLPVNERAMALTREVNMRVTNPEARKVFGTVARTPVERDALMKAAVQRAGITHCWMTDPQPAASVTTQAASSH